MALTKEAVEGVFGPLDDSAAAEIAATGASAQELREAQAWLASDEALVNDMHSLPKGRVAEVIEILRATELPSDDEL